VYSKSCSFATLDHLVDLPHTVQEPISKGVDHNEHNMAWKLAHIAGIFFSCLRNYWRRELISSGPRLREESYHEEGDGNNLQKYNCRKYYPSPHTHL
jgi:hypothetical protein